MDAHWQPSLDAVMRYVTAQTGLIFSPARLGAAEAAVQRSMTQLGINTVDEYIGVLKNDVAMDALLAEITVGETYFFREPAQFTLLREDVLPQLASRRGATTGIRAWSAACASGEEAYSLAILLEEQIPAAKHLVLGTDIARARLLSARQGRYRPWSLRGLPDTVVGRYFRRQGNLYQLSVQVRRSVEFRYLNLAGDSYPSISAGIWGMDIILCRNVLIYFDRKTIARVAKRLVDSLSEDGWLLLGASDPVLSDIVPCTVVQTHAGLVYRRASVRTAVPPAPIMYQSQPAPAAEAPLQSSDSLERDSIASDLPDPLDTALERREFEEVVEIAQTRLTSGNEQEHTIIALVRALSNLGRLAEAGRACALALDRHRMSLELLYLHAVLLVQAGRAHEAVAAARRALYIDRSMIVAHLILATALLRAGSPKRACRSFANAEQLLETLPPETIVDTSDGESAGRLLAMVRTQLVLLSEKAA